MKSCRLPVYGIHDGSRLLACSNDLAEMFGAGSGAELVGSVVWAFIAPEAHDEPIRAVVSGVEHSYRCRGVCLDGSEFPIQVASLPIRFEGNEARLFTVRDLRPVAIVVDDEPPVARMTAALMGRLGYQTYTYTQPREAVADFAPQLAAVLITDVVMPELDGIALARQLRTTDPGLPIVFVSGYSIQRPIEDALSVVVAKPFTVDKLRQALDLLPERARASLP